MVSRIKSIAKHLPSKEEVKEIGKSALLTGTVELPDNKCTFSFRLIKQFVFFIYFMIQFIYPLILLALEKEYHGYNITCSAISFLALLSQFLDIPDLLKTCKKLLLCCKRKCRYEKNEEVKLCMHHYCEGDKCKKCLKWFSHIANFISDSLVFPSVICSLLGFINDRTWELKTGLDYFDFGLFILGVLLDIMLVKGKLIWKYLGFIYFVKIELRNKGKSLGKCPCCNSYSITLFYLALREIMHITMFGMVSCKLYADNYSTSSGKLAEESYIRIEGETWFAIIATWYMPTVSFIYFIIINIFMYYRSAYVLSQEEHDDTDVRVSTDLLLCSCIRNPCAILLIYIVLPTYIAFNVTANAEDDDVPRALSDAWGFFQLVFNISFIIAHIQAFLFHICFCTFPCVYCYICICTNAGKVDNLAAIKIV